MKILTDLYTLFFVFKNYVRCNITEFINKSNPTMLYDPYPPALEEKQKVDSIDR